MNLVEIDVGFGVKLRMPVERARRLGLLPPEPEPEPPRKMRGRSRNKSRAPGENK